MHSWKKEARTRGKADVQALRGIVTWRCSKCRRSLGTRHGNYPEEEVTVTSLGGTCEELIFRDVTES